MDNGEQTDLDQRARLLGKMQLVLEYDLASFQVTIGGDPMVLSLAQMICDEGARLLEEQRRIAAAQMLQQRIAEAQRDAAIAAAVRNRG